MWLNLLRREIPQQPDIVRQTYRSPQSDLKLPQHALAYCTCPLDGQVPQHPALATQPLLLRRPLPHPGFQKLQFIRGFQIICEFQQLRVSLWLRLLPVLALLELLVLCPLPCLPSPIWRSSLCVWGTCCPWTGTGDACTGSTHAEQSHSCCRRRARRSSEPPQSTS